MSLGLVATRMLPLAAAFTRTLDVDARVFVAAPLGAQVQAHVSLVTSASWRGYQAGDVVRLGVGPCLALTLFTLLAPVPARGRGCGAGSGPVGLFHHVTASSVH